MRTRADACSIVGQFEGTDAVQKRCAHSERIVTDRQLSGKISFQRSAKTSKFKGRHVDLPLHVPTLLSISIIYARYGHAWCGQSPASDNEGLPTKLESVVQSRRIVLSLMGFLEIYEPVKLRQARERINSFNSIAASLSVGNCSPLPTINNNNKEAKHRGYAIVVTITKRGESNLMSATSDTRRMSMDRPFGRVATPMEDRIGLALSAAATVIVVLAAVFYVVLALQWRGEAFPGVLLTRTLTVDGSMPNSSSGLAGAGSGLAARRPHHRHRQHDVPLRLRTRRANLRRTAENPAPRRSRCRDL